jgi:hypothetical protein
LPEVWVTIVVVFAFVRRQPAAAEPTSFAIHPDEDRGKRSGLSGVFTLGRCATAEGELASDVGTRAGPYAKVLAEEIIKPGIEAVVMFRAVQRRVRAAIRQELYLGPIRL